MKINEALIKKIVDRIVAEVKPQKVIVFGSLASSASNDAGDIDLLVISNLPTARSEQVLKIDKLFEDRNFPLDILVYSSEEVDKFKNLHGSLIHEIMHKGRVIYDKAA